MSTEAKRAYDRERYQAKKEAIKARVRARYAADPEKVKAYQRAYRQAHPELVAERKRGHHQANRAAHAERTKAWKAANPEKVAATNRQWKQANRHRQREYARRREALKRGSQVERIDYVVVEGRDAGMCLLCGLRVDPRRTWPDLLSGSVDHIVPIIRGGPHVYSNVQLAHLGCNISKGAS